jgi:hypothetical protein
LIQKLETTRRGMRGYQRWRCLLQVAVVGLALLGLLAAADYLWPLPWMARAAGLGAVAAVALVMLFRGLVLPAHRFGKQEAAVEVEETFPELGQRVRTTLEYVEPTPATAPALPALVDALTTDTDRRTRGLPIEGLVPWKSLTWLAAGAAGLLVLFTAFLVKNPEWRIAALRSLLLPSEYTQLAVKPGDHTVKTGQDLNLEVTLTGRPVADATLRYRTAGTDEDWTKVSLAPPDLAAAESAPKLLGTLQTTLKDCRQDLEYRVDAGPVASPTYRLTVLHPLVLKKTETTIEPPAYTRRPVSKVAQANVKVITGSKVGFRFTLDRAAQTARLHVRPKDAKPGEAPPPQPLRVEGTDLVGELAAVRQELEYEIVAEAADGMKLEAGKFRIQLQPDRKPTVKFLKPKDQIEVTPSTEVHMKFEAEDDFGLAQVGVVFQVGNGEKKTLYLKQDPAQPTRYQGEAVLPLEEHKVDFQEGVTYYAFAEDNNPEKPQRATTDLQFIDIRPYKREFQLIDGGGT